MREALAYCEAGAASFAEIRHEAFASTIGTLAIRSLYREVALSPKPGLVSPLDSGSHRDMDYRTFLRSLAALRSYFPAIFRAGTNGPAFSTLQRLGIDAEKRMLEATGGVNTHRGAIFNIGLLCAAAGALAADGLALSADALCAAVTVRWGDAILATGNTSCPTHGTEVRRQYGYGGARQEAAAGFPSVRNVGLPAYRQAMATTGSREKAAVQALFALIAHVDDTNLLWRGGVEGLMFARSCAEEFLARGGVTREDWLDKARAVHKQFVERNLSPGGSADLLGVTLFLDGV